MKKLYALSTDALIYIKLDFTILVETLSASGVKLLSRKLAVEVKEKPEYLQFCSGCNDLQVVDLTLLLTDKDKRAFFINLHNLLSVHGLVEMLATRKRRQVRAFPINYPIARENVR